MRAPSTEPPEAGVRGIVFDIQHYAIYDGPGIRSVVFLKGCPLRCAWCPTRSWARDPVLAYDAERCVRCGSCVAVCPNGALSLSGGAVSRDAAACTLCGRCAAACEAHARELIGRERSAAEVAELLLRDNPSSTTPERRDHLRRRAHRQHRFLLELLALLQGAACTPRSRPALLRPGLIPELAAWWISSCTT
jgi:NAD-dependent dihydropyrimidine dehydrogenase PreA subunit